MNYARDPLFDRKRNSLVNTSTATRQTLKPRGSLQPQRFSSVPKNISTYPQNWDNFLGIKCNLILEGKMGFGRLYLGDFSAALDKKSLKARDITHVLTVGVGMQVKYYNGIKHKVIMAYDMETYNLAKHFEEMITFLDEALNKGNCLVHCFAGVSRSATTVIIYLMKTRNLTYQEAHAFVKKRRRIIYPNAGFVRQMKAYESKLVKNFANDDFGKK